MKQAKDTVEPRGGMWLQTFTGRQFWPLDPRAEDVCIEDIAHALSLQCRYAGHCRRFYSVAEHSVLLADHVPAPFKLWALLHDAAEAYVQDIVRPLKADLPGYKAIEARVMATITERFCLSPVMPDVVKEADNRIIGDERFNLSTPLVEWQNPPQALGLTLRLWAPEEAERQFLNAFGQLTSGYGLISATPPAAVGVARNRLG